MNEQGVTGSHEADAPSLSPEEFAALLAGDAPKIERPDRARNRIVLTRAGLRDHLEEVVDAVAYPEAYRIAKDALAGVEDYEDAIRDALADATDAYFAILPRIGVARDPFTGGEVRLAIDTYGVDGPWWNYEGVLRPFEERPPTLLAFTGALRLDEPLPWAEHLAKPGPGLPYVIPRLLQIDGVQAVIRELTIGTKRGWVITYFARQRPPNTPLANDWGADHYPIGDGWDTVNEDLEPRDIALASWIANGKLAWIAPGDESLTLRRDAEGCPYLGLPGETNVQRLQEGELWLFDPHPLPETLP